MPRKRTDSQHQQIAHAVRQFLKAMPKEALIDRVLRMAERDEDLWKELRDECQYEPVADSPKELIRWAETAIAEATAPGLEYGGDYEQVKKYFRKLLDGGQVDAVVKLGETLLEQANHQMEMSDESLMYDDVAACMGVVFTALERSSLSPSERMKWVWTISRHDGLGVCDKPAAVFWGRRYPADQWGRFADYLLSQLPPPVKPTKKRRNIWSEPPQNTAREGLVKKAVEALLKAGREENAVELYQREAEQRGSYVPLVDYLIGAGRGADAAQWVSRGMEALISMRRDRDVSALRDRLRQLREQERDWAAVAALQVEEFFHHPSLGTYQTAKAACERIEAWRKVRPAVMAFLASSVARSLTAKRPASWPLPQTGNPVVQAAAQEPQYHALIDIACDEKNPDEVLKWYDRRPRNSYDAYWGGQEDKIAQSVAATHPDRAVDIWKHLAERHTDPMRGQQYDTAVRYLAQIRGTLEDAGRNEDWLKVLEEFRQKHRSKSKLLRLVDAMASHPRATPGAKRGRRS